MEVSNNVEPLNFNCNISKNTIEYKCYKSEKEAHIEYSNIDPDIYKSYFILLRTSIDTLKSKGYEKIVQLVTEADWRNYLKNTKWNIRNEKYLPSNDKCYVIECNIDDALECISKGLGMQFQ